MTKTIATATWALTAVVTSEFLGYLLHRLLHSGWIPFLSAGHMKHHLLLYGPLQKQRPSAKYFDATTGQLAIGNIGVEWLLPAAISLIGLVGLFQFLRVPSEYQALFFGIVLAWRFWVFSYLHDRMYVRGFWMERAPILRHWFCWARNLHDIHHRVLNDQGLMDKNFGIGLAFFDWLFGTMAPVQPPFNHAGLEAAREKSEFVTREQSDVGRVRDFCSNTSNQGENVRNRTAVRELLLAVFAITFAAATVSAQQNHSSIVYVSNGGGGITEVNAANNSVIATAPFPDNANGVVVTPDGKRIYATDRDRPKVIVFDAARNVSIAEIPVGNGPLGLAITPDGSLIYSTNQFDNTVSVISTATNKVVATVPTGSEPIWVTFSHDGSLAYVSNQGSDTLSVVSTASSAVIGTISVGSLPFQSALSRDGRFLWVSAQGEGAIKIVDVKSNTVVNSIPAGPNPRGIAFSPNGMLAYVADFASNTVAVIAVPTQSLTGFITVGNSPWGIAMSSDGLAYVANFGSNTISVIESNTNTVTATLPSRGNPEDVTISRRSRPLVLSYTFTSIAPLNSPYSLVRALNDNGDAVGDYAGQNWVGYHGFLRTHSGRFITIDPPGAEATSAFGINNHGFVVGAYRDVNGVLHGFRRSPAGLYTTVDFPGAGDSQLTGINNRGQSSGVYDFGSGGSTLCPGPNCQAVSFLAESGSFSAFEDPNAASAQTFASSINDLGQIAGFYNDPSGNTLAFVHDSVRNSFRTVTFPMADAFSFAGQINNPGTIAGEYRINFEQGFLATGSCFLSLDHPDSDSSGLRAVNDRGAVGGWFVSLPGGTTQAYIATPK